MKNENLFEEQKTEYTSPVNMPAVILGVVLAVVIIGFSVLLYFMINKGNKLDVAIEQSSKTVDYKWESKKYKNDGGTGYEENILLFIKGEGNDEVVTLFNKAISEKIIKEMRGKLYCWIEKSEVTLDHAGFFCAREICHYERDDFEDIYSIANFNSYNGKELEAKDIFTEEGYKEILKDVKKTLVSKANIGVPGNNDFVFTLYPTFMNFSVKIYDENKHTNIDDFDEYLTVSYKYSEIDKYIREDAPIKYLYEKGSVK